MDDHFLHFQRNFWDPTAVWNSHGLEHLWEKLVSCKSKWDWTHSHLGWSRVDCDYCKTNMAKPKDCHFHKDMTCLSNSYFGGRAVDLVSNKAMQSMAVRNISRFIEIMKGKQNVEPWCTSWFCWVESSIERDPHYVLSWGWCQTRKLWGFGG